MMFLQFYCVNLLFRRKVSFLSGLQQKYVRKRGLLHSKRSNMMDKFRNVRKRQISFSGFEGVFLRIIYRNRAGIGL